MEGIGTEAVNEYIRLVNFKAEKWLRKKITKEGIGALRSILEGEYRFQIIGEESDIEESNTGKESENSSEEDWSDEDD